MGLKKLLVFLAGFVTGSIPPEALVILMEPPPGTGRVPPDVAAARAIPPRLPPRRIRHLHAVRAKTAARQPRPDATHSSRVIAYSTSPCSSPGMRTGQSAWNVRTSRMPTFSITRRDAVLTAIVDATTRRTPSARNPWSITAWDASAA